MGFVFSSRSDTPSGKGCLFIPWDLPILQAIYRNPYLHSPEKDSFPHQIAVLHSSVPFHRILKSKIHLCFFHIPADISLSQQSTHLDSDNFFRCKCNDRGTRPRKKDSKTRQTHSFFGLADDIFLHQRHSLLLRIDVQKKKNQIMGTNVKAMVSAITDGIAQHRKRLCMVRRFYDHGIG